MAAPGPFPPYQGDSSQNCAKENSLLFREFSCAHVQFSTDDKTQTKEEYAEILPSLAFQVS